MSSRLLDEKLHSCINETAKRHAAVTLQHVVALNVVVVISQ